MTTVMMLVETVFVIFMTIATTTPNGPFTLVECLQPSDTQLVPPVLGAPSQCPLVRDCVCKWSNGKQGASCESRNLQTIPMQLPTHTQVLDLNSNNLRELPQHIFQDRRLTNLQKLHLSDCKISYIADEAFAQLTNLVELDLSHNYLQQVPTKSLAPLHTSLRRLTLAHNPIHVLDTGSFNPLSRINMLDLSSCQIAQMKMNAFQGLDELRELKLGENRLTQLPLNVISDLKEFAIIDLYANPWHCDCELRQSIDWMQRHHLQHSVNPTCVTPPKHKDVRWQSIKPEEFMCPPVIINKQNELVVGAGSNVSLACSARGSPPLTFVWFQDEKNLTGRNGNGNQSDPPPSTKLLEEKRYEIAEELGSPNVTTSILYLINLKLTDTSLFLCWVENSAGYTLGNFSLIVNDSPPAHLNGEATDSSEGFFGSLGSSFARVFGLDDQSTGAQIATVLIVLVLLLVITIICLLILKQITDNRSSKSSSQSTVDFKAQQVDGGVNKLSAANKFSQANGKHVSLLPGGRMFASVEDGVIEGGEEEERMSLASSGSQSSCRKGTNNNGAVDDLGGFIEHMRSGIINMDYHSMSPVIQFNKLPHHQQQQIQQHNQQQQHMPKQEHQPLAYLNHFPSASNASSQVPSYYGAGHQASNGSNSMATTLSDLSPSSGSASTSFANPNAGNLLINAHHQQQYLANTLNRRHTPQTNCDFQAQQHQFAGNRPEMATNTTTSYTSDYQSGYSEDQLMAAAASVQHQQTLLSSPMYNYDASGESMHHRNYQPSASQVIFNGHQTPIVGTVTPSVSSRPNSMNTNFQPQAATMQDLMQHQRHQQQQQQQMQQQQQQAAAMHRYHYMHESPSSEFRML